MAINITSDVFTLAINRIPAYKPQKFNDGTLKIYKVVETAVDGDMPVETIVFQESLRFHDLTLGLTRYYTSLHEGVTVSCVKRCPRKNAYSTTDTDLLIAVLQDGKQYEIKLIQWPERVVPKCMDLTLVKVLVPYVIG